MSRSLMLIKFPNDEVFVGCYSNTNDMTHEWIETPYEVIKHGGFPSYDNYLHEEKYKGKEGYFKHYKALMSDVTDAENVEIYCEYGKEGFHFPGKANRKTMCLISPRYPYPFMSDDWYGPYPVEHPWPDDGMPGWAREFLFRSLDKYTKNPREEQGYEKESN